MTKRVLITGATGFMGSHILEILQNEPLEISVACRTPEKLPPSYSGLIKTGDLRDSEYVADLVKNVDIICHAAAWTSLWSHKQQSHDNFLIPTLNLIRAAKLAGVKHFIFPSTTSAAAPVSSRDSMNEGIPRHFWPHLCNVIHIENELQKQASKSFSTVILRLGIFVGRRYNLGILPVLLPRLNTHLVPWLDKGKTRLPLIDGEDIARAFLNTINTNNLKIFERINIVGVEQPTVEELINFIHDNYNYPQPHFTVPFSLAYKFAWLMEKLSVFTPWEPLVTRSLIHLMEETQSNNQFASEKIGYQPSVHWKDSISAQIEELQASEKKIRLAADT